MTVGALTTGASSAAVARAHGSSSSARARAGAAARVRARLSPAHGSPGARQVALDGGFGDLVAGADADGSESSGRGRACTRSGSARPDSARPASGSPLILDAMRWPATDKDGEKRIDTLVSRARPGARPTHGRRDSASVRGMTCSCHARRRRRGSCDVQGNEGHGDGSRDQGVARGRRACRPQRDRRAARDRPALSRRSRRSGLPRPRPTPRRHCDPISRSSTCGCRVAVTRRSPAIRAQSPETVVMVCSSHDDGQTRRSMAQAGAVAYVVKGADDLLDWRVRARALLTSSRTRRTAAKPAASSTTAGGTRPSCPGPATSSRPPRRRPPRPARAPHASRDGRAGPRTSRGEAATVVDDAHDEIVAVATQFDAHDVRHRRAGECCGSPPARCGRPCPASRRVVLMRACSRRHSRHPRRRTCAPAASRAQPRARAPRASVSAVRTRGRAGARSRRGPTPRARRSGPSLPGPRPGGAAVAGACLRKMTRGW